MADAEPEADHASGRSRAAAAASQRPADQDGTSQDGTSQDGTSQDGTSRDGEAGAAGGMPGGVAAAWGVRERPHKGPRPALSLGRIVPTAVRVADAEGLDAVSMGRVAAELGTAPMSLYRHVASKEELLTLMVDAAWGEAPEGPLPGEGWRAGLTRWSWGLRSAAQAHPWVVRIPLSGLPIMPNEVAWFENALACQAGTGLSEARKGSVIMLLAGYVRNQATTQADIEAAIRASGLDPMEWMASYPRMLAQLTDPVRFPALARFIEAGVFEADDGPDDEFIFGLNRILDGVEALIDRICTHGT
jgi:AcrR family transcriptional regulator